MLGGGNLIVLGFCENSQLPKLLVKIGHIFGHPGLDNSEIVIVHFLSFWRHGSEKGSAGENQILTLIKQLLVHKEVFLLGSDRSADAFNLVISEKSQNSDRLFG